MATERDNRWTVIVKVGLLGTCIGLMLGLIEAFFMRRTYMPVPLMLPHVPPSFWIFAPLLDAVTFGLAGLLTGLLAALPSSRFLGMIIIAGLAGVAAVYFAVMVQYSQVGTLWYPVLERYISPPVWCAIAYAWMLAVLWATRRPSSRLGFLYSVPVRRSLQMVLGVVALLGLVQMALTPPFRFATAATHASAHASPPNIVLMVWDTARADHFSSYGYSRHTTPNIDQFARQGVLFENAISASSWTLPAMASVFTSLLPHQHGASKEEVLGTGPRTLAEILDIGKYETAGFNANPYYGDVPWGLNRGFETYLDSTTSLEYSFDSTRFGRDVVEPVTEAWFHRSRFNQYNARQLNEYIYRWLARRSDRPYFLFINYNDAHEPYEAPAPYDHLYGQQSERAKYLMHISRPARFDLPPAERAGTIAAYDDCLSYIDSQAGELLRHLQQSPEWSNTYVIITADHGEGFGEHGTYSHAWNLYREVLHVPLIVVGPGIPAGVRVTDVTKTQQIFATVLDWAGLKKPILHSNSLARIWAADYKPDDADEATVSELLDNTPPPYPAGMISITTREWHFISRPGAGRSRLYHWTTDPLEQQDVAGLPENAALVEHLRASLLQMVQESYRPWREPDYLQALVGNGLSSDSAATKLLPSTPGAQLVAARAGAEQALFPPNPESPSTNPDKDLLESLPYDAR